MRIDLHVHSTSSDGTLTPSEVIRHALEVGVDVVGLTDHDSAAGWQEASAEASRRGVGFVPGIEISTIFHGAGVHLLAYLPDPAYPALDAELARILDGREGRLGAMIGQLRAAGVEITEADVRRQVGPSPAIGRPHIADVLVAKGFAVDRGDAFARWLSYGQPGYAVRYATPTATMIELVNSAGGVCVIAHPWGRGSRRVLDHDTLAEFAALGLGGLEVAHQDHSMADRSALRTIALDLDLVVTGSSDFHGAGKVDHDLGCNVTDPEQFARLLELAGRNAVESGRPVPEAAGL